LLSLALGGCVVVLAASGLGAHLLFQHEERQALNQLTALVVERAHVGESMLRRTEEVHQAVGTEFADRWPQYQSEAMARRFDALMERYPDGAWRNRREMSDGRRYSTGWISKHSSLSDDLRRRIVLFYDLCERYGPGAALRRDNLFLVSVPEEANMGYDPFITPNWIFDLDEKFSHLDYEWGRLAYQPALPGTRTRWSSPALDVEVDIAGGAVFSGLTPVHVGRRHLATVGTTILLNEFVARLWPDAPEEARYLLYHTDGRLFADTHKAAETARQVGRLKLVAAEPELAPFLLAAANQAGPATVAGLADKSDRYYAVAKLSGPDWYIAALLPGATIRARAATVALWTMAGGFGVLLALLALHAVVLRRNIARPLLELTRATERIATGAAPAALPAGRDDELGRLAARFNDMARTIEDRDAALRLDKQRIEEALKSLQLTEERWRGMTEHAPDIIAVVDAAGKLTYVSPAVEKALGVPPAGLLGSTASDLVRLPAGKADPRLGIPTSGTFEFTVRHSDGGKRVLEATCSDQRSNPAVQGVVVNIRDITEVTSAQEELARQREALHQSEKLSALGALLAGVAHELNNPLSVVIGRAAQMELEAQRESDAECAARIRQAAERCARIVKTFLAMARHQEVSRAPTDLNQVIASALDVMDYNLHSNGIDVATELAPDLPRVLADSDQLVQVFVNLFANAQQAMAGQTLPRRLTVRTFVDARRGEVKVDVEDSGPGVPADVRARIFEPFFTTKAVGEGTGLGLSVSLGIMQAHEGSLALAVPETGQGARFTLAFPAHHHASTTTLPAPTPHTRPGKQMRVLVVDDEPEIAELIQETLRRAGHEVCVAGSGEEALALLDESNVDAVFTDLKMPGMDGPTFYRELQCRHPQLAKKVIAVTGDTLSGAAREFVEEAGMPVIDKPFALSDILAALHMLLDAKPQAA
jgi:two-component system NtrC family sensor kinase